MSISRRQFLAYLAGAALAVPLIGAGYGFGLEPAWLDVTETDIALPGLAPAFDGFRIALVSDLHYGGYLPLARLERVVRLVNELDADLIALAGDLVSQPRNATYLVDRARGLPVTNWRRSPSADAVFGVCVPQVAQMRARLGALTVLGNHDHWVDAAAGRAWLDRYGIGTIENRHHVIERAHDRLVVAGVGDLWEGTQDLDAAFAGAPPAEHAPRIVLCHNPDFAVDPHLARHRVSLLLCGHTHGGQVYVPGLGAPILPIRHKEFARGLVRTDWGQVYISRGVGQASPPVRVLSRPEIALIRLRPAG
jgi:uncharacterized protein